MENKEKKSLLERYGIPIHHFDFQYIKECKDDREMEKIVHVLRSNQEGHFPDLTKCAEERLLELKPHSRLFRVEEKIKGREALQQNELQPIYDWNKDIKLMDKKLQDLLQEGKFQKLNDAQMPPIRQSGSISQVQNNNKTSTESKTNKKESAKESERIKSTDYKKWDKYDAEEEILRLDLAEEREQEAVERQNRVNLEKIIKQPLTITEITEDNSPSCSKWCNLSDIEKEKISEEYRIRGNEYFRSKEYDLALKEYTCAIECYPEQAVAAYNNRALIHFKQQHFSDAIKDCEASLNIDMCNVKARLRLAESNYAYGRRRESYPLYIEVLKLDPNNSVALKAITELRKQFEDLPPPHATRLRIQETATKNSKIKNTQEPLEMKIPANPKSKMVNYDLADLIKPNRVVPNKFVTAAENLGKNMLKTENKQGGEKKHDTKENKERELIFPGNDRTKVVKKLIEEL